MDTFALWDGMCENLISILNSHDPFQHYIFLSILLNAIQYLLYYSGSQMSMVRKKNNNCPNLFKEKYKAQIQYALAK